MSDFFLYLTIIPWFGAIVFGVFGLVFGSFLTFLFYRLQNNEPWLWGDQARRSRCPSCKTILKAQDLIPVLSWCVNRGQCRTCKTTISIRYPLIEITTAIIFIMGFWLCRLS